MHAINDGVGPISGSATYALDRLARTRPRDAGVGSFPPDSPPPEWAASATENDGPPADPEAAIQRIIRESVAASGVQGFVTGLGGLAALPVALPANLAGSLIINARMVGAIAYLRNYKLNDPHTEAMVMLTVAGSSVQGVLSELGVVIGKQAARQVIAAIPIAVIRRINQRAGFFLVAKYGTKRGAVTLAKLVPGVGGIVGGGVDAALTRAIGKVATKVFV